MTSLPIVANKNDIAEYADEQVRLIGRYTQIDVQKRQDSTPVYNGHVAIVLDDNTHVLLYPTWHSAAKRPAEEIERLVDQRVAVEGTIFPKAPSSPDNSASLVLPCMTKVTSISVVK